jgi:hypothetical protein
VISRKDISFAGKNSKRNFAPSYVGGDSLLIGWDFPSGVLTKLEIVFDKASPGLGPF